MVGGSVVSGKRETRARAASNSSSKKVSAADFAWMRAFIAVMTWNLFGAVGRSSLGYVLRGGGRTVHGVERVCGR